MHILKNLFFFFILLRIQSCYSQDMLTGHQQLLVVTTSNWEAIQGSLQLYERSDDVAVWMPVGGSIPIVIGRSGLAWGIGLHPMDLKSPCFKIEGDGKSPAGIFSLGSAFGHSEMSHLKMEYLHLNEFIEAVDDLLSSYYNSIVDRRTVLPDWQSSEKMGTEPLYEIGLVINHNFPNAKLGAGSAIFMHIWRNVSSGTAGCTAMSRENLTAILNWLDRDKNPVLVQLPACTYAQFQQKWNLPEISKCY